MAFLKKIFKSQKTEQAKKAAPVSDTKEEKRDPSPAVRDDKKGTPKAPKSVAARRGASKRKDYSAHKVLLRPLITEKATDLAQFNKYAFAVAKDATKTQVAEAVRNTYGVTPVKVNVVRFQGKKVRQGRQAGKTKSWKKAIITLRPEDRIEIYEGV